MTTPRSALREELIVRGHAVSSDTVSTRDELYVLGANDLAAALFEFREDPRQAFETMYQGSWTEGLPPRFAVMPAAASTHPEYELLEQVRIIPLLYEERDGTFRFLNLAVLDEHLPGATSKGR